MKWNIGQVEVTQIIEIEGGELIQDSIPDAIPEHIKKIDWLFPNFADKDGKLKALDSKKTELAYQLYDEKKHTIKEICQMLGISKPSLYAYLEQRTTSGNKISEL